MPAAHLSLQHGAPLSSACRACQEEDCHGLHDEELGERPAIRGLLIRMKLGFSEATKALLLLMRNQAGPTKPTLSAEGWREGCLTLEELGRTVAGMQADRLMKCWKMGGERPYNRQVRPKVKPGGGLRSCGQLQISCMRAKDCLTEK